MIGIFLMQILNIFHQFQVILKKQFYFTLMGQCCQSLTVPIPFEPKQEEVQSNRFQQSFKRQKFKDKSIPDNQRQICWQESGQNNLLSIQKTTPPFGASTACLADVLPSDQIREAESTDKKASQLVELLHVQNKQEEQWLQEEQLKIEIQLENKEPLAAYHQLLHLYQACMHHYKMHQIENACEVITKIEAKKAQIMSLHNLLESEVISQLKATQQSFQLQNHSIDQYCEERLQAIKEELEDAAYYENEMNKAPFFPKYNQDGIRISTREEENTIGVMVETELHIPFENIASVLNEVTYLTDFLPYCQKSTLIKDCARNSKVGYVILNFPIIAKRQAYFEGKAYFRLKTKKDIFLFTRSIHDKPELQKSLEVQTPINDDFVQLNYKYFVISYKPLREGVGNFKFSFNIDNGVHFLPSFIEDLVVREFAKKFFKGLMSISQNFSGSKWERSMLDNPQLFTFIRESLSSYLEAEARLD